MEQFKIEILDILYQQLQLLAEKASTEYYESDLCSIICDFIHIAKTILRTGPTPEQKQWIFETTNKQIKMLSEKKSVGLSDTIDDLAQFIFHFF